MLIALALAAAAAAPAFDPMRFFAGETRGHGQLKIALRARVPVSVRGTGAIDRDGTLVLDQIVTEGGKPPRTRQWRLRQVASGRYAGTLTDARGMVTGEADGPRLHLRFTTTGGFAVEQWLVLAPGGRFAGNRLVARRFGITVATLDEEIGKVDPPRSDAGG